jgi:hypothetical protein
MSDGGPAKLRIDADAADVRKAMGQVTSVVKKANADMLASSKKTAAETTKTLRELAREYATLALNVKNAAVKTGKVRVDAEKKVTKEVTGEVRARLTAEQKAAQERERLMARLQNVHARVEQMRTATTLREVYRRVQAEDQAYARAGRGRGGRGPYGDGQYTSRFGQGSLNVVGGIRSFASSMHNQIQGAREARASTERTLDDAFVQTIPSGATVDEIRARRAQILGFARQHGIREEEIAPAFAEAQTRFAFLSNGGSEQERTKRTGDMLRVVQLARVSGNDPTDTANFYAALMSRGMTSDQALSTTRAGVAASYAGSVSLGSLSQQALGSLLQSVAGAQSHARLNGGDQAQAGQEQVRRFFADLQVQAMVGQRAGMAGNREVGLERTLSNDNMMNVVHARLAERFHGNAGAMARVSSMFTVRHGHASLNEDFRDPTQFATQLYGLFDGDPNAMANFMGARGGWGKPAGGRARAMMAPQVQALANMMAIGPDAQQTRDRIMNSNITDAQLGEMNNLRAGEDDTELARNQQENRDALRDNNSELRRLSDSFANWSARNPFTATAFTALGTALGGGFLGRVGTFQWGGGPGGGPGGVPGAAPAAESLATRYLPGAAVAGAAIGGTALAAYGLYQMNEGVNNATGTTLGQRAGATLVGGDEERRLGDRIERNQFDADPRNAARNNALGATGAAPGQHLVMTLDDAGAERFARAMQNNPLVVQIDPHDIDHSASANNTQARANGGS